MYQVRSAAVHSPTHMILIMNMLLIQIAVLMADLIQNSDVAALVNVKLVALSGFAEELSPILNLSAIIFIFIFFQFNLEENLFYLDKNVYKHQLNYFFYRVPPKKGPT